MDEVEIFSWIFVPMTEGQSLFGQSDQISLNWSIVTDKKKKKNLQ